MSLRTLANGTRCIPGEEVARAGQGVAPFSEREEQDTDEGFAQRLRPHDALDDGANADIKVDPFRPAPRMDPVV